MKPRRVGDPKAGETISSEAVIETLQSDLGDHLATSMHAVIAEARDFARRFADDDLAPELLDIWFQATNDYLDLHGDLWTGRGRAATRAARSLIEHLVNLHTVLESEEQRKRYTSFEAVVACLVADASVGLSRLTGREKSMEEHQLRKLRRTYSTARQAALELYGRPFNNGWSASNLRQRAEQHDLDGQYTYYKISSALLHGSAGGNRGIINHKTNPERPVRRLGLSLSLCIDAYHEGITAYLRTVKRLSTATGVPAVGLTNALEAVLDDWPHYRRTVTALDQSLWPTEANDVPLAIAQVYPSGVTRWFRYERATRRVCRAQEPTLDEDDLNTLQGFLDEAVRTDQEFAGPLFGVDAEAEPSAVWFEATAIIDPDDLEDFIVKLLATLPRAKPTSDR